VGGGIAGMEAARVLALRGHDVTLFEASDRLGGTLHIAGKADFKKDIAHLLAYQIGQLQKSGNIEVRLETEATQELLEADRPDVLFIATGSKPLCETDIKGLGAGRYVTPEDVYRDAIPSGRSACIVGGGSVGCETALYLAKKGWAVIIVEIQDALATDLFEANREMLLELLAQYRVKLFMHSEVKEITHGAVLIDTPHGGERCEIDIVVLCIGRQPVNDLVRTVPEFIKEVHVIGDSVAPRKIKDAIWEAYKLAITV
jgi:2-enoate reductase